MEKLVSRPTHWNLEDKDEFMLALLGDA